jgi:cyclophilin family peptidyl-prolyl cis-trans isomerase
MLQIPVPENGAPGDKVHMARSSDGQWSFSRAIRGETPQPVLDLEPAASSQWLKSDALAADLAGPGVVTMQIDTTKGPILMRIVPKWSPLGCRRLLKLVDDGYFADIAIYRAIRGGLVQFGVVKDTDPRASRYEPIADDPLIGVPFEDGSVSFAATGPGARKCTLCLFLGDFRGQLGSRQPETPVGKVCPESMAILKSLYSGYGDIPQCGGNGPDPNLLMERGNEYILEEFPLCDFVTGADRWYDPRWV